jgi:hypothetical protein
MEVELDDLKSSRHLLLTSAILLVLSAILVAVLVIPPVRADTFPGSTPEAAVPAFWVNILLSSLSAIGLGMAARKARGRSRGLTAFLVILLLLMFLLAVALNDAARAYGAEGPAMRSAASVLYLCSGMDFIAWILVLITVFQQKKLKDSKTP